MADKGWRRAFDDPIPLPGGGTLATLRDAATYITKLPKAQHDAPAWRAAIEALMLVAEHGVDTMLPRVGIMRALYPDEPVPTPCNKAGEEISDRNEHDVPIRLYVSLLDQGRRSRRQALPPLTRSGPDVYFSTS